MIFTGNYEEDRVKLMHFLDKESVTLKDLDELSGVGCNRYNRDNVQNHDNFIKYHGIPSSNNILKMKNKLIRIVTNFFYKYKNRYEGIKTLSFINCNKFLIVNDLPFRVTTVRIRDYTHAIKAENSKGKIKSVCSYWILLKTDSIRDAMSRSNLPKSILDRYSTEVIEEFEREHKKNNNKTEITKEDKPFMSTPFNGLPIEALLKAKDQVEQKELEREFEKEEEVKEPERLSDLQKRLAAKAEEDKISINNINKEKVLEDLSNEPPIKLEIESPTVEERVFIQNRMQNMFTPDYERDSGDEIQIDDKIMDVISEIMNNYSVFQELPTVDIDLKDKGTIKVLSTTNKKAMNLAKQIMLYKGHTPMCVYTLSYTTNLIEIHRYHHNEWKLIGSIQR